MKFTWKKKSVALTALMGKIIVIINGKIKSFNLDPAT